MDDDYENQGDVHPMPPPDDDHEIYDEEEERKEDELINRFREDFGILLDEIRYHRDNKNLHYYIIKSGQKLRNMRSESHRKTTFLFLGRTTETMCL